jgi:hypothetical protein
MEFDADWIIPAIFIGIMLVRGIGSRLFRAGPKSEQKVQRRSKVPDSVRGAGAEIYRGEDTPKPIEPR